MNVNSVSFKAQDFNSYIAEDPKYTSTPTAAASSIKSDTYEKSGSVGKTIAKTVVGLGVLATTLGLLRGKVETFQKIDLSKGMAGQEGIMGKAKFIIAKSGEFVNEYASKAWNGIKKLFGKNEDAAKEGQKAAEGAKPAATATPAATAAPAGDAAAATA